MQKLTVGVTLAAALGLAACRTSEPAPLDGALAQDLARAAEQTASLTLPGTGSGARTRVVSPVELSRAAAVPKRATPRKRGGRKPVPTRARVVPVAAPRPAPEPVETITAAAEAEEIVTTAANDGEAMPDVASAGAEQGAADGEVIENPRPTPVPAEVPNRGDGGWGRGGHGRGGDGGWGGVVIRGGGVDGDHCERDRRPRGRLDGMISINVIGPIGRGTFPRY